MIIYFFFTFYNKVTELKFSNVNFSYDLHFCIFILNQLKMLLVKNRSNIFVLMALFLIILGCQCNVSSKPKANQTLRQIVIEEQIVNLLQVLSNKTIAMLTNPTSIDSTMRPLFERIL